ncbi:MAG: hypothetical protein JO212_19245 [Acetobacteraceae bacterium]|nr:hypothetical protein [Acetobacteraceae bacterium]
MRRAITLQQRANGLSSIGEDARALRKIKDLAAALLNEIEAAGGGPDGAARLLIDFGHELRFSEDPNFVVLPFTETERNDLARAMCALPGALPCLAMLAGYRARKRNEAMTRGDRPDTFQKEFFWGLCYVWELTLGYLPAGRISKTGDYNTEVINAIRGIALHAADRITSGARPLRNIAGLSDRRIADLMDEARRNFRGGVQLTAVVSRTARHLIPARKAGCARIGKTSKKTAAKEVGDVASQV